MNSESSLDVESEYSLINHVIFGNGEPDVSQVKIADFSSEENSGASMMLTVGAAVKWMNK